jgi:hypothetical protein
MTYEGDMPRELAKSGKKNGGTNRVNVPNAEATNKRTNLRSRNSRTSIKVAERIGARSLMNHAAGRPVPRTSKPIALKVQAVL